jgi:PAS domain S-box-containing protein
MARSQAPRPNSEAANTWPDSTRLQRALDLQPELVCEWAPDGTILYCNRSYRAYFKYDESVIGRKIDDLITWVDGEGRELIVRQLRTTDLTTSLRSYDNGRSVEWTNTLVRDDDGAIVSILAVGRDVTDRLEIERTLRYNEERFRLMVTHIWDSILLLDREGGLLDATSAYRVDLDYPPGFWLSANLLDVLHPDDQPQAIAKLSRLIDGGLETEAWLEVRAIRANGATSWLELNATNLLDDPTIEAIVLTVRNIDVRKRIEFELADRQQELQAALHRQEGFVAQVSHELRNPLHGMLGLSEMLAGAELGEPLASAAKALYRQTTTLRRIVDDLLDVAQLEVGTLRVNTAAVDLLDVVRDAAVMATQSAPEGVLVVAADPHPAVRYVQGDDDRIRQALANLLSNACKHTVAGRITIVVSNGRLPGRVRVSVQDTGEGIDATDVERLFQPYERGRGDLSRGVGLGLAIVKGTVEAMGGEVGARPRAEGGSEFWIELRVAVRLGADDEEQRDSTQTPRRARESVHALVVDDDPVNQLVAKLQLQQLHVDVATAISGEDAWGMIGAQEFDVLFVDVQMQGMSGFELLRLVREQCVPSPFVAIMTASATAADRRAAQDAGADAFVAKPATLADITAVIERVVSPEG